MTTQEVTKMMEEFVQKKADELFPASIDEFTLSARIEQDLPWAAVMLYIYGVRPASRWCPVRQVAVCAKFAPWDAQMVTDRPYIVEDCYSHNVDDVLQALLLELLRAIRKLHETEGGEHPCLKWETPLHTAFE